MMKKTQARLIALLEQGASMERGTLCRLRRSPSGGWYYNHQSWERGRNRVRYVPAGQVKALRRALVQHARFCQAVEAYIEEAVRQTRRQGSFSGADGPDGPRRRTPAVAEAPKGRGRAGTRGREPLRAPRAGAR